MKLIFVDVETTGIPCPQSGLIQLAGIVEIDGTVREEFELKIRPFAHDVIQEEALTVNGISRADLDGYEEPGSAFKKFVDILSKYVDRYNRSDKFHFIAYNAMFDSDHVRAWFGKNDDKFYGSWFWHPPIDVMGLAAARLMSRRPAMKDFKLLTVAGVFGLKVDGEKAHDAKYDVALTRDMYQRLAE